MASSTTEVFSVRDESISDNLAKRSEEIITNKEKKLIRDRKAVSENKAYIWPNGQLTRKKFVRKSYNVAQRTTTNIDHNYSDSSISSRSSASSTSHRSYAQIKKKLKPDHAHFQHSK